MRFRSVLLTVLLIGLLAPAALAQSVPIIIVPSCAGATLTRGALTVLADGTLCTGATIAPGGTVTAIPQTGTGGQNSITVTNSSAQLLAARTAPKYALSVKNESATASIAICFGSCTAALNTAGSITLAPGQMWSAAATYIPLDAIIGISSAATSPATIQAN